MPAPLATVVMKLLAPTQRRVRLMVARAVIKLVDDTLKAQGLQLAVQADVLENGAERFQQYGFTSHPRPGAEALVVHVGGDTAHPVVVAVEDRRYRPTDLAEGEVALYTAQDGKRVLAKADGSLELGTTPTDLVALASPTKANDDDVAQRINDLAAAIAGWTPVAQDGGAALKAALSTWLGLTPLAPVDVAATEVKAK